MLWLQMASSIHLPLYKAFQNRSLSEVSWGHAAAAAQHSLSICTVTFCLGRDLFALCIQIFADAPESCPLSPAAPVFSAPTRQSKKLSRQNRPLAVYNPQALDIQNGKRQTNVHLYSFTSLNILNSVCIIRLLRIRIMI